MVDCFEWLYTFSSFGLETWQLFEHGQQSAWHLVMRFRCGFGGDVFGSGFLCDSTVFKTLDWGLYQIQSLE